MVSVECFEALLVVVVVPEWELEIVGVVVDVEAVVWREAAVVGAVAVVVVVAAAVAEYLQ